jgi:hypothetical protein
MGKQALQVPAEVRGQGDGTNEPVARPRQLRGWRTVKELTEELRFPSPKACRAWLSRNHVVGVRRGRVILVDGLDIDRLLRGR